MAKRQTKRHVLQRLRGIPDIEKAAHDIVHVAADGDPGAEFDIAALSRAWKTFARWQREASAGGSLEEPSESEQKDLEKNHEFFEQFERQLEGWLRQDELKEKNGPGP